MHDIRFTDEETAYVMDALRSYRDSLRMEIVDTDNSSYKRDLRRERDVLDAALEKLDQAARSAGSGERAPGEVVGFRLIAVWGPES